MECGIELTDGSIKVHQRSMHGTELEIDWNRLLASQTEHLIQLYDVSFLKGMMQCP